MTSRRILFLGLALFAFTLISLNHPTTAQDALAGPSPRWEYKIADTRDTLEDIDLTSKPSDKRIKETLEQFLNEQGSDGWELVAYSGSMAIYKRKATK